MKLVAYLMLFTVSPAFGAWTCNETASSRSGNVYTVCGIGIGNTEADARIDALREAKREFDGICQISSDCTGKIVSVDPLRNDCSTMLGGRTVCYRGFRYTVGDAVDADQEFDRHNAMLDATIAQKREELKRANAARAKQRELAAIEEEIVVGKPQHKDLSMSYLTSVSAPTIAGSSAALLGVGIGFTQKIRSFVGVSGAAYYLSGGSAKSIQGPGFRLGVPLYLTNHLYLEPEGAVQSLSSSGQQPVIQMGVGGNVGVQGWITNDIGVGLKAGAHNYMESTNGRSTTAGSAVLSISVGLQ